MNRVPAPNARFTSDTSQAESAPSRSTPDLAASFMNPSDVAADPRLTLEKKRAVLAAWASDIRAVPNAPGLRQLDNGAVIRIDDILQVLTSLDNASHSADTQPTGFHPNTKRRPGLVSRLKFALRRNRSDDDDEPPPCPAIVMRPPRGPLTGGDRAIPEAVLAA